MAAELTLRGQQQALIDRIKAGVSGLKSVVPMEDLEEAMETTELLPAAIVIWSGDFPEKPGPGMTEHPGQKLNRYWSVIVVLELTREPGEALDLLEAVNRAGVGWRMCRGLKFLAAAGTRFIGKFDNTRVIYEVRFAVVGIA